MNRFFIQLTVAVSFAWLPNLSHADTKADYLYNCNNLADGLFLDLTFGRMVEDANTVESITASGPKGLEELFNIIYAADANIEQKYSTELNKLKGFKALWDHSKELRDVRMNIMRQEFTAFLGLNSQEKVDFQVDLLRILEEEIMEAEHQLKFTNDEAHLHSVAERESQVIYCTQLVNKLF